MHQLELIREFNVPVARLYEFWTTPELMAQWFAPGEATVPEAHADCVVGGAYKVVMANDQGETHTVGGEYQEVVPGERLVFTWKWEHAPNVSLVDLRFAAVDGGRSRLELRHSEFADQDECDKHNEGWAGCLDKLEGKTSPAGSKA